MSKLLQSFLLVGQPGVVLEAQGIPIMSGEIKPLWTDSNGMSWEVTREELLTSYSVPFKLLFDII